MIDFPYISDICRSTPSKIVMLVVDGLGGMPHPDTGKSELEAARLPNLDELARHSACGLTTSVMPGIAPGSGPGHMALFGYDPVKYLMGRGVLEALGIGVQLAEGDVVEIHHWPHTRTPIRVLLLRGDDQRTTSGEPLVPILPD